MLRFTRPIVIMVTLAVAGLMTAPAGAITFGQLDGEAHPNVGVLVVDEELGFVCSGTLIAPDVFLTAAHCAEEGERLSVSFDPDLFNPDAVWHEGTAHVHPAFGVNNAGGFWHDIAVIVFDAPISGIAPADLPPEGLLDEMKADKTLRTAMFTAVGYGVVREDKTGAFGSMFFDGQRRNASQTVLSLQKLVLSLSQQPATGDAGTCYGDSGGPHFLGDVTSSLVVSTSSAGDAVCQAAERTYRLDTPQARSFLSQFVTVP